jgi:hypothetical protein
MKFELDEKELAAAVEFEREQDAIALEQQKKMIAEDTSGQNNEFMMWCHDQGYPYYGATGGSMTYCFTPTSIGTCVSVQHGYTKAEKNITNWGNF